MTSSAMPLADHYPLLGSAPGLMADPLGFFRRQYAKHGPVFEVRVGRRRMRVLAGLAANRFLSTEGKQLLSAERFWKPIAKHNNAPHLLLALEGEPHVKLRRLYGKAFTQRSVEERKGSLRQVCHELLTAEKGKGGVSLQHWTRTLVSRLVHHALTHGDAPLSDKDLRAFMETFRYQSNALLLGKWPRAILKAPWVKARQRRVLQVCRELAAQKLGDGEGWFASVQRGRQTLPELFTPGDVELSMLLPFVLGVDTVGSTLAFALHHLHRHPELLEQISQEVDGAFQTASPEVPSLKSLVALPTLRGLMFETLRLYPAAFGITRFATEDFEFQGYAIPKRSEVFIFTTGSHMDRELFPNPYIFDVERYREPRNEHKTRYALSPYGGGTHVCLGIGMGEGLLLQTLAILVHDAYLQLENPSKAYGPMYDPSLSLDHRCKFRVAGLRKAHLLAEGGWPMGWRASHAWRRLAACSTRCLYCG